MELSTGHTQAASKHPGASSSDHSRSGFSRAYPPFVAGALRMAALGHLESYKNLVLSRIPEKEDTLDLVQGHSPGSNSTSNSEQDRLMRLRIIQEMLLDDIGHLTSEILILEKILQSDVGKHCSIDTILAVLASISVFQGDSSPALARRINNFLYPIIFLISPVAVYRTLKSLISLWYTTWARKSLDSLHISVRAGKILQDSETAFFKRTNWDWIPWRKVEDFRKWYK